MTDKLLWIGTASAICGIGLLRWSWSRNERSIIANLTGWTLLLAAAVVGGVAAGAWGIAIVLLAAMGLAAAILAWTAATSPARRSKSPARRVRMLPEGGGPLRVGKRLVTFSLVIIAGFIASVALAIALRVGALGLGWSEADANASALFAVPLIWSALATVMLMLETRREQIVALFATSFPLVPALMAGG